MSILSVNEITSFYVLFCTIICIIFTSLCKKLVKLTWVFSRSYMQCASFSMLDGPGGTGHCQFPLTFKYLVDHHPVELFHKHSCLEIKVLKYQIWRRIEIRNTSLIPCLPIIKTDTSRLLIAWRVKTICWKREKKPFILTKNP